MNYRQVVDLFKGTLARRDVSDEQAKAWIDTAIIRISRILRTPAMERVRELTPDAITGEVSIPGDFLELRSLRHKDGQSLVKLAWADFNRLPTIGVGAQPVYFCRVADKWRLWPVADTVVAIYYADQQPLSVDTDENVLTRIAPDLINYAACVDACSFFVDDRLGAFETLYVNRLNEIMDYAVSAEEAGGLVSVQPLTDQAF